MVCVCDAHLMMWCVCVIQVSCVSDASCVWCVCVMCVSCVCDAHLSGRT